MTKQVRALSTATDIQRTWIKLTTRAKGATRTELHLAAQSAYAPDAWHLKRLAKKFGYKVSVSANDDGIKLFRFSKAA